MNEFDLAMQEFFASGGVVEQLPYRGKAEREVSYSTAKKYVLHGSVKEEENLSSDDLSD